MRNFFLLILLINLLAYAYQSWIIEPDVSVEPTYLAQDVPDLLLASVPAEIQLAAEESAVEEPAETPAESEQAYRCLRIGPFPRETDADAVRLALQKQEATVRQTAKEGRVWVGYWVQTAGQGSRSGAEKARDSLVKGGMPDVYILPDNENYRISLGVFRLRASADQVVRQAQKMGFDSRVVERYQPGTNFWLLARIPGDRTLKPGDLKSISGQILRTENMVCEDAGV
jgi:cell division protein FtsN